MKFRERLKITELDEQRAVDELRSAIQRRGGYDPVVPSNNYWSNMIVRMNQRLDSMTSGKALSVSWAARVAIPGVVAIISFYIGLHYYVPEQERLETAFVPILASLPQREIDSLLAEQSFDDIPESIHETVFTISGEDAAQYYISAGEPSLALEMFSDTQVEKLLTTLTSPKRL